MTRHGAAGAGIDTINSSRALGLSHPSSGLPRCVQAECDGMPAPIRSIAGGNLIAQSATIRSCLHPGLSIASNVVTSGRRLMESTISEVEFCANGHFVDGSSS